MGRKRGDEGVGEEGVSEERKVPKLLRACVLAGLDPDDLVGHRALADGGIQLELPGGVCYSISAERLAAEA